MRQYIKHCCETIYQTLLQTMKYYRDTIGDVIIASLMHGPNIKTLCSLKPKRGKGEIRIAKRFLEKVYIAVRRPTD